MFPIVATLVFASNPQLPEYMYPSVDENRILANAHTILLAEFVDRAGSYRPNVFEVSSEGNVSPTEELGFAFRYRFTPKLVMYGEAPAGMITALVYSSTSLGSSTSFWPSENYCILAMVRPFGPERLFGTGGPSVFFQSESADQWKIANLREMPTVPAGQYTNIGATPHERYAGVLIQAYERDPKPIYLQWLERSIPRHPTLPHVIPEYAAFDSSTFEPRLFAAAGDNVERKARVYKTSAIVTGEPGYRKFWEFFDEFDATHDTQETVWIEIPTRSGELTKLMNIIRNARTAAAKASAIRATMNHASEERKDFFISLLSDPNQQVRVAALLWLDELQSDPNFRALQPAPNLRVKRTSRDVIENEEELIRYWQGR
jgi:hypothetical protein